MASEIKAARHQQKIIYFYLYFKYLRNIHNLKDNKSLFANHG